MAIRPDKEDIKISIGDEYTTISHPSIPGGEKISATDTLVANFNNALDRSSGLLPPVVRYITPDYLGFIMEQTPVIASISYTEKRKGIDDNPERATIALPWVVYLVRFTKDFGGVHSLRVFFRDKTISSEDDPLYYVPLTNIYQNGTVCLDVTANEALAALPKDVDVASRIRCVTNCFWSSVFNTDLRLGIETECTPHAWNLKIKDTNKRLSGIVELWKTLSIEDILNCQWRRHTHCQTVKHLINIADEMWLENSGRKYINTENVDFISLFKELMGVA